MTVSATLLALLALFGLPSPALGLLVVALTAFAVAQVVALARLPAGISTMALALLLAFVVGLVVYFASLKIRRPEGTALATTSSDTSADTSDRFYYYGLWAVVAGLATLLLIVLILVLVLKTPSDTTGVIGAVASPVVAIVSAYFGISVSASAQNKVKASGDQALAAQQQASDKALAAGLAAPANDETTQRLLSNLADQLAPPHQAEPGQTK